MNARPVCFTPLIIVFLGLTFAYSTFTYSQTIPLSPPEKKGHPKLESVLYELADIEEKKGPFHREMFARERSIKVDDEERITVYIVAEPGKTAEDIDRNDLRLHSVEVVKSVANIMKARVPVNRIKALADTVKGISMVRLPDVPVLHSVTTEGVGLAGASLYHSGGYTGAGVGIAIIDLEFGGICQAILSGEIPPSTIFVDCSGPWCVNVVCPWDEPGRHGTAVAEIIHDMAPGAQLYLLKIQDPLDAVTAYSFLPPGSVRVVNYSVGWFNQNFGDGTCYNYNPVCLVNDAYAAGILWVNSAGNSAKRHYAAVFSDSNANGTHDQLISLQASFLDTIGIELTWDAWPGTDQDYDLYLLDYNLSQLASSTTVQNGTQRPSESISYLVKS